MCPPVFRFIVIREHTQVVAYGQLGNSPTVHIVYIHLLRQVYMPVLLEENMGSPLQARCPFRPF